ncbi:MAG: putative double-stranded DNA-binding protein [Prokaryotic dsDNA virus sp.]|nr:MAG: putative double-stranded DNA-binding protein [Prokaryotic dsDNA virus sp.]|tara:strand:+ start:10141 stop:10404 length:264 start_codon:yes stop_codon:yes gene_type:complete
MTFNTTEDENCRVTAGELRQFVERIERLEAEKKSIADQIREVYAESKSRGYDQKALRAIVGLRKLDKDQIDEQEAVLEMYKDALGMA